MTIRSKFGRKSTKRRPKSSENRPKFALKRFWVLKAVSGTPRDALGTHPGRLRAAPGSILERPGRAKSNREPSKSASWAVLGRSEESLEGHSVVKACGKHVRNDFWDARLSKNHSISCVSPLVGWFYCARPCRTQNPRKSKRFGFQNRVQGPFERASRAQKRPVRAKKFARSAFGASENLKVSANESTSSEQERLQAAKTRAPPEAPEAFFGNFEMDFLKVCQDKKFN